LAGQAARGDEAVQTKREDQIAELQSEIEMRKLEASMNQICPHNYSGSTGNVSLLANA
jgi:hypothetical protein